MSKYLNLDGLGTFWDKIKSTFVKKNDNGYVDKSQIPVKSYRASNARDYVRICRCQAPTTSTSPTIDCNIRMGDATVRVIIQGYNGWRANVIGYLNSASFKFYAHQVVVEEETFYDIIAYHTTYCRGFYSSQFLYDYDVVDFSYWAAPYTEYTPTSEEEIPYIMLAKSTASSGNAPVKVNEYGDLSPITVDDTPTAGHTANLVSSDGIRAALDLKQDLLSEQTAYSAKGTATKVPQITTNSLGQVTKIEEKTISGVAPASHTHGNIANGGTLTDTAAAAAGNDYVVIRDADNAKIQTSTIKGTDVADAVSKKHSHSTLTLSTTAQKYDGSHTLALPSTDPYTSARTPASHTHGNIANGGTLQTNDITIASGDKLVVTDSSDSNKVARTSVSFDGSTTTKALTPKGTFETFLTSHQNISGKSDIYKWNAVTQGQKWSRIFYSESTAAVVGSSGILWIGCTRASVVCNAVFLVTAAHNGAERSNIVELSSCGYSELRCRLVVNSSANYYFEVYDTANSIASGTTQQWYCRYIPLRESTITTYTAFTDGTTIPSNYATCNDFTITVGNSAFAIKDITRSGKTFTATRQNGSTFTFTQQDSDTKVTSSENHYTPATASGSDVTASASDATAAWSIDVVKGVTLNTDGKGHVTGMSVTSGKIPANPNTDTKVTQTKDDSGTTEYPLLMAGATNPNGSATTARYDSNVKLKPSTNTISANISGNAASADSATNVNLVGDVKTTSTTNGDTIRVKAGSGTAAEITIINAKHAASADSATNSINSAVAADTSHKLYLIGTTDPSGYQALKTDTGIYATTNSGELNATKFKVSGQCTLQYNSTTKSLDFIFA